MIPVFVVVRDRFEQLKSTVSQLERGESVDIILVDNNSTYEPTVEWLRNSPHKVIYLNTNTGHHAPWISGLIPTNSVYCVTDPDVKLVDECPNDWPSVMLELLQRFPDQNKVGVSLRLDNIPDHYYLKHGVIEWETQFWSPIHSYVKEGIPVYSAAVDTTLAMYHGHSSPSIAPALRIGWPYTGEHLAWYVDSNNLTEDETYYRTHADRGIASWKYSDEY